MPPAAGSDSPSLKFLTATPRRTSRASTISQSAFIFISSTVVSVSVFSVVLRSMSAVAPLKSNRWPTSFRAWFSALSTSWKSMVDVMSNDEVDGIQIL